MKQMMIALALTLAAQQLLAATTPATAIDWGSAGKSDPHASQVFKPQPPHQTQEAVKPELPDSGFDCDTVTRMSWDRPGSERERRSGPEQVRRCSRDGFSLEVTPPSN